MPTVLKPAAIAPIYVTFVLNGYAANQNFRKTYVTFVLKFVRVARWSAINMLICTSIAAVAPRLAADARKPAKNKG